MTAVFAWITSPLWGTLSYLEAGWLLLTAGILLHLRGHLCDARAQLRVAQSEIERRVASGDVWSEVLGVFHQACFGLVGLYAALTPSSPVDPGRVLGTLTVTGLLVAVQLTNLVFATYRRRARRWVTDALRREKRLAPQTPMVGGRRSYDIKVDPPSHERRPEARP